MVRLVTALGLLGVSVVVCLGLSFAGLFLPDVGGSEDRPESAEEAARTAACGRASEPLDFRIRETRRFAEGVVILFDARCAASGRTGPSPRFAGAATVQHLPERSFHIGGRTVWEDRFWQAHTTSFHDLPSFDGPAAPLASGRFISREIGGGGGWSAGIGNYVSINGRILVPGTVAAVEGLLDDGSTIRGGVERDVWVLFALEAGGIREVRALDRGGEVLQRIDVTSDR